MRNWSLIVCAALLSACQPTAQTDDLVQRILRVETGLVTPIVIEGDSSWTIEERMAHYGIPGVSVAVIDDYRIAWVKSYGVMDTTSERPVTDSTLFQAASISKPVFAMAALKLVQQGELQLDEDVNAQLRSWKVPENAFTRDEKVTLKRLLGHVAGTTVHGFPGYSPGTTLPTLDNILNGEAPANTPAIFVDQVPGGNWRYSGGGYCVASQLILDVQGGTIAQHMQDLVLGPLGMSRSTFQQPLPEAMARNAASGHLPDGSAVKGKWHVYPELSPDGLWTTATDLAHFVIDLQKTIASDSGKVLNRATAKQMVEPFGAPFATVGLFLEESYGERYFDHNGWNEGFCGWVVSHVQNGKGAVVLINANQPEFMGEVARSIARAYQWPGFVPQHKEVPLDTTALDALTGRYKVGNNDLVTIARRGNKLFREPLLDPAVELVHVGGQQFVSRTDRRQRLFAKDSTGALTLRVYGPTEDDMITTLQHMADGEHIPLEAVLRGDRQAALDAYTRLKATHPEDRAVHEQELNDRGYQLMNSGRVKEAQDLFYINMQLYPKSANVYDSYAEACLKRGDKEQALLHYKRTLAMEPQNDNATRIVAELEKELGATAK